MQPTTNLERWLRGPAGFSLAAAVHLALFYALVTGLIFGPTLPPPNIETVFIDELKTVRVESVATGDPFEKINAPDIPVPEKVVSEDTPTDTDTILAAGEIRDPPDSTTVLEQPLLLPRVDPRFPLARPEYPAGSIRNEEQGRVMLRLRVAVDGRVLAAEVVRSSGYERLDRAAVEAAVRMWRLQPAMRGGAAEEAWFSTWVTFSLIDR
jgi:TonB family protein